MESDAEQLERIQKSEVTQSATLMFSSDAKSSVDDCFPIWYEPQSQTCLQGIVCRLVSSILRFHYFRTLPSDVFYIVSNRNRWRNIDGLHVSSVLKQEGSVVTHLAIPSSSYVDSLFYSPRITFSFKVRF